MSILCSLLNLSPHVHSIAAVPICSSKMFSSTRMTSASPGLRSSPASEWLCLIHKALYVFITDTGHVLKVLFSDCSHVNINFPLCMYVCVCVSDVSGLERSWPGITAMRWAVWKERYYSAVVVRPNARAGYSEFLHLPSLNLSKWTVWFLENITLVLWWTGGLVSHVQVPYLLCLQTNLSWLYMTCF